MACASAATGQDTIVVTGKSLAEKRVQAENFVRRTASVVPNGQFARRKSFCPRVIGLAANYVPIVIATVRDAAAAAHVVEAKPGCRADLAIVFTADSDALMGALAKRDKAVFKQLSGAEESAVFAKGRAIRWWYGASPGGDDGASRAESTLIGDAMGSIAVDQMPVWSSSLIKTNLVMTLSGSIVVIDVRRVEGLPLGTVAAFAAMVSFAQVSMRADFADSPSILAVRPGNIAAAPGGLTIWDRAYLRELYRLPANREAWTQRAQLAAKIASAIE